MSILRVSALVRGGWPAVLLGCGATTLTVGLVLLSLPGRPVSLPALTAPQLRRAAPVARVSAPPVARVSAPPIGLRYPRLFIQASVVPVGLAGGAALAIPNSPQVVGWYREGAAPGSAAGTTILAGHVDSARLGEGALFRLSLARVGDSLWIRTPFQTLGYRVFAVAEYPKGRLPARSLFSQTVSPPRLAIVTCGGPFDKNSGHYLDNIVVLAAPTGVSAPGAVPPG
ncbi:MAG: class F sortase [Mycobacteriales bacterium]